MQILEQRILLIAHYIWRLHERATFETSAGLGAVYISRVGPAILTV